MAVATLSSKGQITIPKQVREGLGVSAGDRLEFIETGPGRYEVLVAVHDIRDLKGIVGKAEKPASIEDMNRAIASMGRE